MSTTSPSGLGRFPYRQEAVRVCAQLATSEDGRGEEPPARRFSVDPSLTDFSVLRNLCGRAFEQRGPFSLSYRVLDDLGAETWLPMVSDWDLSAAFLSASEPDLQLIVTPRNHNRQMNGAAPTEDDEPWDVVASTEVPMIPNHHRVTSGQQQPRPKVTSPSGPGLLNTVSSLFSRALTLIEDISITTSRPPLSDSEFRSYLDPAGVLQHPSALRHACYHGGVEPALRRVVWKHLLNVYPAGLGGAGRMEYVRGKAGEYRGLREAWRAGAGGNEHINYVSNMVRKDVLRTDRHLPFFHSDENPNIGALFNLLTTFSLNHPSVGYCQGMSDLASPLLVVMGDEAQAYICFCSLMRRLAPNFSQDGMAMSLKFSHLASALAHYDPYYWAYLKSVGADDLLFCYRWLLLELKREFAFEDSLRMMEVLWASLPSAPGEVRLYETKFTPSSTPTTAIPIQPAMASYTKLAALRRSSSCLAQELRSRRVSKRQAQLSLDDSLSDGVGSLEASGAPAAAGRRPFHSLDDTIEILSSSELLSTSPFEVISLSPQPRLVKNLGEFWGMGRGAADHENGVFVDDELDQRRESDSKPKSPTDRNPPDGTAQDLLSSTDQDSGHCNSLEELTFNAGASPTGLPPSFGGGNPFLMFLALTLLLQHRDHIIRNRMDYNETAMYFDKLVRKHNVGRVLAGARNMYDQYAAKGVLEERA